MALEFEVISERKGSNQGGRCILSGASTDRAFYIKHVMGSKIHRKHSYFVPCNQPIYEAVTFEMARKIGLSCPDFYVLMNKDHDIRFVPDEKVKCDIREGKRYYFVSDLRVLSVDEDLESAEAAIRNEAVYRDLLQISDIEGRKQNYFFDSVTHRLIYLDLGCSFVDAHEGFIELKSSHPRPLNKKELKKALKMFSKYCLICNDNETLLPLNEFVQMPRGMSLHTLNPTGKKRLTDLISAEEIDEIVNRIAAGLYRKRIIQRNGNSDYIVEC